MSETHKSRFNKTFVIGLVIAGLGWLGCLNLYWIIFLGPVFLVGLLIVWISKVRISTKVLSTILPLLLWYPGTLAFFYFASRHMTPETFLIPETFRGQITLVYNERCGEEIRMENGRLSYKIPNNGVLIVKNKFETGIIDHEYYFVDESEKRIEKVSLLIQQDFNEDYTTERNLQEPPRNKIGLFLSGTGGASTERNIEYEFHAMHVNSWDSLRVYDSKNHDRLVDSLLFECRRRN